MIDQQLIEAVRAGGEALDHGERGPALEISLLRDAGWLAAPLPLEQGGKGWGTSPDAALPVCEALMALGGASLAIARLYEGHVNALRLIDRFGNADQHDQIVTAVGQGAMLGVWGADSERPVTVSGGALRGVKAFASGLGDLSLAIITARDVSGLQMVIVDADDPARADQSAWDVDGMVGSRSGRFETDGLPAREAERLGGADALLAEPDFHGGVWRIAACYAGALVRLAELSMVWLKKRNQLSDPLMQARLGQIAIEAESARLWSCHAAIAVEAEADTAAAVTAALFAREAIEAAAIRQLAMVERLGGTAMHGRRSELGRIARDLRFYLRQADLDGKLALATSQWTNRTSAER